MRGPLCGENLSENGRRLREARRWAPLVLLAPCRAAWLLTGLLTQGEFHFLPSVNPGQRVPVMVSPPRQADVVWRSKQAKKCHILLIHVQTVTWGCFHCVRGDTVSPFWGAAPPIPSQWSTECFPASVCISTLGGAHGKVACPAPPQELCFRGAEPGHHSLPIALTLPEGFYCR